MRYHLVTSTDRGGFSEYTAASDAEAIAKALGGERKGYHGRPVYLAEVKIGPTDRHRPIDLPPAEDTAEEVAP